MPVDEIGAVEKGPAHRRQLGRVEIVHPLLAKGVHLRADVERQVISPGQLDHLVELVHLQAALLRVGDVPVTVGNDVQGDNAFAHQQVQERGHGLFALRGAVEPGRAGQGAAGHDEGMKSLDAGEAAGIRWDIAHASAFDQAAAHGVLENGRVPAQVFDLRAREPQPVGPKAHGIGQPVGRGHIGGHNVAFGGVAFRRQRQHIGLVGDRHGVKIGVQTGNDGAVAVGGEPAQLLGDGLHPRRDGAAAEADAHMVGNAGFARRIDLAVGEFGQEKAGLDAGATPHPDQLAGFQKLIHAVEDIEIHDAHELVTPLLGQPGQTRGRVAAGIEGKKGVAVHVGHLGRRRDGDDPACGQVEQGQQGLASLRRVEMVELSAKVRRGSAVEHGKEAKNS